MAITFIDYGRWISVSDTMILSGTIWDNRNNRTVKGEDTAEPRASLIEKNVAYQTGTGSEPVLDLWPYRFDYLDWYPGYLLFSGVRQWDEYMGSGDPAIEHDPLAFWITGLTTYGKQNISAIPFWSLLYDKTMIPARDYVNIDPAGTIKPWWTESAVPTDGDSIATADGATWDVINTDTTYDSSWDVTYTDRDYATDDLIDSKSDILTTTTRVEIDEPDPPPDPPEEPITFLPGYTVPNFPIPKLLYPSVTPYEDKTIFNALGNWWTDKGLGRMVPKLWCETIEGLEGEDITIESVGGSGFLLDKYLLSYAYDETTPKTVNVINTSTDGTVLLAQLFKATGINRDDSYFVGSDGDYGSFNLNLVLSKKYDTVTASSSTTFTVRPSANPIIVRTLTTDVIGEGITCLSTISSQRNWGFGPNNWQTPASFTISASPRTGNSAAIVSLNYFGVTHYFAVEILSTGTPDITVDPTMVTMTKFGNDDVDISITTGELTTIVDQRLVVEQNFNTQRDILKSLNRTITYVPISQLEYTSSSRKQYSYNGSYSENFYTDPLLHTPTSEEMWDEAILNATLSSTTNPTFNGVVYDFSLSTLGSILTKMNPTLEYGSNSTSNLSVYATKWSGCKLKYPSEWAFDNGYIKSIKIFAVVKGRIPLPVTSIGGVLSITPNTDGDKVVTSYSNIAPTSFDSIDFGLGYTLCDHSPDFVTGTNFIFSGFDSYSYSSFDHDKFKSMNLSLIIEATDPTTFPVFDIGDDNLIDPGYSNSSEVIGYNYWENSTPTPTYTFYDNYTKNKLDQKLTITGFIVVTDFNFEHLNPDTPFVPDTLNDPTWCTTTPI